MERHVGMRIALAALAAATALTAAAAVTAGHAPARKSTVAAVADAANGLPSGKRMHKPF